jgi:hypothetical protein
VHSSCCILSRLNYYNLTGLTVRGSRLPIYAISKRNRTQEYSQTRTSGKNFPSGILSKLVYNRTIFVIIGDIRLVIEVISKDFELLSRRWMSQARDVWDFIVSHLHQQLECLEVCKQLTAVNSERIGFLMRRQCDHRVTLARK